METGRARSDAGLRRAASAAARLADVVCRAERCAAKSLVPRTRFSPAREFTGRRAFVRQESFPGQTAALSPGRDLSLPFHHNCGTPSRRCMVAARGPTHLLTHGLVTQ